MKPKSLMAIIAALAMILLLATTTVADHTIPLGASGTDQSGECTGDYFKIEDADVLEEGTHTYTGTTKEGNAFSVTLTVVFDEDDEVESITVVAITPGYDLIVIKAGNGVFETGTGPSITPGNGKAISDIAFCLTEETTTTSSTDTETTTRPTTETTDDRDHVDRHRRRPRTPTTDLDRDDDDRHDVDTTTETTDTETTSTATETTDTETTSTETETTDTTTRHDDRTTTDTDDHDDRHRRRRTRRPPTTETTDTTSTDDRDDRHDVDRDGDDRHRDHVDRHRDDGHDDHRDRDDRDHGHRDDRHDDHRDRDDRDDGHRDDGHRDDAGRLRRGADPAGHGHACAAFALRNCLDRCAARARRPAVGRSGGHSGSCAPPPLDPQRAARGGSARRRPGGFPAGSFAVRGAESGGWASRGVVSIRTT